MKKLGNWWVPVREEVGIRDILAEWEYKHKPVLSLVKKRRRVIQAGGYVGVFPKGLSGYFDEVITFEPVQENWLCLLTNLKDVTNIKKFNCALGNSKGLLKVKQTVHNNCGAVQLEDSDSGHIKVVKLDDLSFRDVDLLWLDLEGFEAKALLGAKKLIKKYKPIIVLENNGLIHEFPSGKEGSEDLRNWMKKEFNYVISKRLMRDDVFVPRRLFN